MDGVTETAKDKIKKKTRTRICWIFVSTFSYFISTTSHFFINKIKMYT